MNQKQFSATSEEVLNSFMPVIGESDERTYRYVHQDTGREFQIFRNITKDEDFLYFLVEVTPAPRVLTINKQGICVGSYEDPRLVALEQSPGPNYFLSECSNLRVSRDVLCFDVPGYNRDSIMFDSIDACAKEVAQAICTNSRYVSRSFKPLSKEEAAERERIDREGSKAFWEASRRAAVAADSHSEGIFRGCHNMGGNPLSKETKDHILSYLNNPSQDLWNDVRSKIVVGSKTLWQAWVASDVKANRSGSVGFPSPETLRSSIRNAVDENMARIERELKEIKELHPEPTPQQQTKTKLRLV